jgi:hypothetical protein
VAADRTNRETDDQMSENMVQVADGSVVVFDKETKEAYICSRTPFLLQIVNKQQPQ